MTDGELSVSGGAFAADGELSRAAALMRAVCSMCLHLAQLENCNTQTGQDRGLSMAEL